MVAVLSARNSTDRPFIVGSPSTAERAISVAQTALPDDELFMLTATPGGKIRNTVLQSWSPAPTGVTSGPAAKPTDTIGCTPAAFAGFPAAGSP